ncbi:MAG TPA: Rrf2 family transcriptional regulator [Syntrophorhabdaceae bacterium]|nr:Rrf2 family transcriptional regulator [Syntrophorhabdaceae bacterium]
MKISTKGRYGLRALIDLSTHGNKGAPVLLSDIARRQGISEKYLEQIAGRLHKSGLVKTVRGRRGGYLLNKPADEIKLSEIIEILEGPINVVDCVGKPGFCEKSAICSARDVWTVLNNRIAETLSQYTLQDIVNAQSHKIGTENPMYYI